MRDKIVKFFFVSIYQVITWVWIGLSIGAYFYNASNKNTRGVHLATLSLVLSVCTMLVFIWKHIFWDSFDVWSAGPPDYGDIIGDEDSDWDY